jgi:hypothetical protein
MEVEGQSNVTILMNKVTCPETSLTQDGHGALTARIMGMQLNTA